MSVASSPIWRQPSRKLIGPEPLDGGQRLWVRPVQREDLDAICAIETASYSFPWSRGNFHDSLLSDYDFTVLNHLEHPLGYAISMWLPDEAHLLNITIAPAWQAQGMGRRFLTWIIGDMRQRGARALMLEVRPSNLSALALYTSMEFVEIGRRKAYYPSHGHSREDALVLSLALSL